MTAFVPIARTMIQCGFGVGELVHAVKLAYITAAIREVLPDSRKINISRIAVATGLTRKEIALLLANGNRTGPKFKPRTLNEQRAFRVLRGWIMDPFFQKKGGGPADLEPGGGRHSFSALVRRYGGDVTPTTVLRELERMNAIARRKGGRLRLRADAVNSRNHAASQIADLARLLRDFASTAQQAVIPRKVPLYFGFRDCVVNSEEQAAIFQRVFSHRAASLLESTHQWMRQSRGIQKRTKSRAAPSGKNSAAGKDLFRIGLGVYLVQED